MSASVLRRRWVGWITAGALVGLLLAAALSFLLSAASGPPESLKAGPTTFGIEADVRAMPPDRSPSPRCEGPPALLAPGETRCLNTLDRSIEVQTITMGLDPSFSAPSGCTAEKLVLPSFSGGLQVPAGGQEDTPGLPIQLKNTPTNQDDCRQTVLHFTFAGTAAYADPGSPVPDPELPVIGAALVDLLLGGALVSAGLILLAVARRRRFGASS